MDGMEQEPVSTLHSYANIPLCTKCKSDQWETKFLCRPAFPQILIGQKTFLLTVRKFISFVTISSGNGETLVVDPVKLCVKFAYL